MVTEGNMILLYILLVATIVLLAWRISHPGDLRLNRKYLARYLKDTEGRGPVRLVTTKLMDASPQGPPEERVFYNVEAEFADTSRRTVLVQVFYPLEELMQEREKSSVPGSQDASLMSGTEMQHSSDLTAKLREDPYKDFTAEERATAEKSAMVNHEVECLSLVAKQSNLFPRLIAHDEQRLITITEAIGMERLDDVWQKLEQPAKMNLAAQLVCDLAKFHGCSGRLAYLLPPGAGHGVRAVRDALSTTFDTGFGVDQEQMQAILEAAGPLYATANLGKGLRLVDGSPRGYYVLGSRVRRLNWAGLRYDIPGLDVIELLCDPALGLSYEQEAELFKVYLQNLQLEIEPEPSLAIPSYEELSCLAIYFQIALIGHLTIFERSPEAANAENPLNIKHWPADSRRQTAIKLLSHLRANEELGELCELLAPAIEQAIN